MNIEQEDTRLKWRTEYGKEGFGLGAYRDAALPIIAEGNVYLNGAQSFMQEKNQLVLTDNPNIKIEETEEGVKLYMMVDKSIARMNNQVVSTELLGKAKIPNQRFENPDGTEITIDLDYFGKQRNLKNPSPGPFRFESKGLIRLKVWSRQ